MSDFDIQGTILLKYTGTNEDVVIPDGIETIGEGAFRNCRFLRNVTIPGTVRKIESNAFSSCTKLQSIVIPEGVEVIYSGAFYYCLKLKTILLPQTLQFILGYAFAKCRSLESIVIPKNVKHLVNGAFSEAKSLKTVEFLGPTTIGICAFGNCTALENVKLAPGMLTIQARAFEFNRSLKSLVIPESVFCIEAGAFAGCDALTDLDIQNKSIVLNGVFDNPVPPALFYQRNTLIPMLCDNDLIRFVIKTKLWTSLSPEMKYALLWSKQNPQVQIAAAERMGQNDYAGFCAFLNEQLSEDLSTEKCALIWHYIKLFADSRDTQPLVALFTRLQQQKNANDLPPIQITK